MFDPATLLTFSLAALALLVIPGPAVLYIVARSLHQGGRAGLASVLGVQTGGLVHVLAATVGLSALVLSSAVLFSLVKYLGAAYLVYLGVKTILSKEDVHQPQLPAPRTLSQVYWQGVAVNALNPKTALFFLAFLPQFIHPEHGAVALQTLALGLLFLALATVSDGTYALLAGSVGRRLQRHPQFATRQRYVTGSIYILLGGVAATTGKH